MTDSECRMVVAQSAALEPKPTRRAGIRERVLLSKEECPHQNLVLLDIDKGAVVEEHPFFTSESFFVLEGTIEITTPDACVLLGKGDLCHLPSGAIHGLRCVEGPGQILCIFAPRFTAKS